MDVKFKSRDKFTDIDKAKKWIEPHHKKSKENKRTPIQLNMNWTTHRKKSCKQYILKIKIGKHVGSCNVQCFDATIYKIVVKKIFNFSVNIWNSPNTPKVWVFLMYYHKLNLL